MYKNNINLIGKIILSMIFIICVILLIETIQNIVKVIADFIGINDSDIYMIIIVTIILIALTIVNYKLLFRVNEIKSLDIK